MKNKFVIISLISISVYFVIKLIPLVIDIIFNANSNKPKVLLILIPVFIIFFYVVYNTVMLSDKFDLIGDVTSTNRVQAFVNSVTKCFAFSNKKTPVYTVRVYYFIQNKKYENKLYIGLQEGVEVNNFQKFQKNKKEICILVDKFDYNKIYMDWNWLGREPFLNK